MPRTFTVEKTVYTYDELPQKAKEKAMDWITLTINDRANYDALKHLEAIYPSLPD